LVWESNTNGILDLELSLDIPISIDYAMERSKKKVKVLNLWSDLGSFEPVYDYLVSIGHPVDENGNMVIGTNNYTAFIGMKDFVLVFTANLILKRIFTGCQKCII
jgi:mannose-1-phosphate guanylyltransferase